MLAPCLPSAGGQAGWELPMTTAVMAALAVDGEEPSIERRRSGFGSADGGGIAGGQQCPRGAAPHLIGGDGDMEASRMCLSRDLELAGSEMPWLSTGGSCRNGRGCVEESGMLFRLPVEGTSAVGNQSPGQCDVLVTASSGRIYISTATCSGHSRTPGIVRLIVCSAPQNDFAAISSHLN